ncbi:hypothetical protein Dimus_001368 [Dionaea muscipula]
MDVEVEAEVDSEETLSYKVTKDETPTVDYDVPIEGEELQTSALAGHALRRDLLVTANQKRSRRLNNRLSKELTLLMEQFNEMVEGMKADVEKVIEENQTLEQENTNLEAAMEAEKNKREKAEGKVNTMKSRVESF